MTNEEVSILLVDDEPDVLDMMSFMLLDDGYKITLALGGQAALKRARSEHFDVVVTDLKMPGMDGIAVASAIKQIIPDADVIIASGFVTPEALAAIEQAGATAHVAKPFTRSELRSVLNRVVANRTAAANDEHRP